MESLAETTVDNTINAVAETTIKAEQKRNVFVMYIKEAESLIPHLSLAGDAATLERISEECYICNGAIDSNTGDWCMRCKGDVCGGNTLLSSINSNKDCVAILIQ